jgi:biopolymer transport protein TolQ
MEPDLVMKGAESLSPWALFLQADFVVKSVMVGLLLASIWTWAIIVSQSRKLTRIASQTERFEETFWAADDVETLASKASKSELPAARVFTAGIEEWRQSLKIKPIDRDGLRARLQTIMSSASAREIEELSDRLNILATVGSVAPFVGLFGTVWGIMRSFTAIAGAQNTSLAVVAPGIAEALFATAIGLFAAIPAVIGYNRLLHRVGRIEGRLNGFADELHTNLSRELDRQPN